MSKRRAPSLGRARALRQLERLFVEERRRTKIIPNSFHGERPVLKLMYAALIRGAERTPPCADVSIVRGQVPLSRFQQSQDLTESPRRLRRPPTRTTAYRRSVLETSARLSPLARPWEGRVLGSLARIVLRLVGWKPEGDAPTARRFVLIAAPHTSNWDLPLLLLFAQVYGVRVNWMGKHTLFHGPMGVVMRALGGIPVRRDRSNSLVAQMVAAIESSDRIALTVPAEGTRAYTAHWKSGFYHIARAANVPVVLGFLDYRRRRGGLGPEIMLTGDVREDMDEIRAFYAGKQGRYPENVGEILLKEEA